MSVTRSAMNKEPVERSTSQMQPFVWEGTDKRGVKMKGEQDARNANLLRAELRKADGRRWRFEPARAALLSPAMRRRVAVADWRPRGRAEARRWLIRG